MSTVRAYKNIPCMVQFIDDDMAYISDMNGDIESSSKVAPIINALMNFYSLYDDEYIDYLNYKSQKEEIEQYKQWSIQHKKEKAEKAKEIHKGYVYILKCADKYKIGFSNNVERRMQQLDTRPFPLEHIKNAWRMEL